MRGRVVNSHPASAPKTLAGWVAVCNSSALKHDCLILLAQEFSFCSPPNRSSQVRLTLGADFGKIHVFSEGDVVPLNEGEVEHGD